jgi:hypothetical protein
MENSNDEKFTQIVIKDNDDIIENPSTESTKYDSTNNINEIKNNKSKKIKKKVIFSEIPTIEYLLDELNDNKNNIKVENMTIDEMLDELNDNENIKISCDKLKKFDEEGIKNMLQKLNCNINIQKSNKETELNNTHVKIGCDYVCVIS